MMQNDCPHDSAERDTAIADGYCPACMAERIAELERENKALRDIVGAVYVAVEKYWVKGAISKEGE